MHLPHNREIALQLLLSSGFVYARLPVCAFREVQQLAENYPTKVDGKVALLNDAHVDSLAKLQSAVEFALSVLVELRFLNF